MSARRFTLGMFTLIVLALAAVAALNRVIDPFWYYRDMEIEGINAVKPRFARFERHVKPALLAREQPQAIVLGNSFAETGFDPLDAAFTDDGRLRSYNFAFAGTGWELEQCAFKYALKHAPIRRAVLGISAGAQPLADCGKAWTGMSVSSVELLLSLNALSNSMHTVTEQRRARPSHTREGRYLYTRDRPGAALRFREYFRRDSGIQARCTQERLAAMETTQPVSRPIQPTPDIDLAGLRAVIRSGRAQGVEMAFVVYPRHALSLELEFACGDSSLRWSNIAALAQAVAVEAPDGAATLWVFDGYDASRGERVIGREPFFWQDPEHFNHELGARMLAAIYGRGEGFGNKVVPGNIDKLYAQLLAQRTQFVTATDWFYADLRSLATPASAVR